jgi:hypothetical protein
MMPPANTPTERESERSFRDFYSPSSLLSRSTAPSLTSNPIPVHLTRSIKNPKNKFPNREVISQRDHMLKTKISHAVS